jgi:hypothetical protein
MRHQREFRAVPVVVFCLASLFGSSLHARHDPAVQMRLEHAYGDELVFHRYRIVLIHS